MRKKILAVLFLVFIFWYGTALSKGEYHYTVQGTVTTINLSQSIQQGTIHLQLSDDEGNMVFDETGSLIGIVTGSDETFVYLMHMVIFEDGSMFVTNRDQALIEFTDPCDFPANEFITNIVIGIGFFKRISEANVEADGFVDYYCDNKNEFKLGGYLSFK